MVVLARHLRFQLTTERRQRLDATDAKAASSRVRRCRKGVVRTAAGPQAGLPAGMPTSSSGFCSTPGTVLLPACTRREGCGRVVREIALQVWCRCSDRGQPGDGAACAGQRRRSRAGSRGLGLLSWRQGRWLGSDEPDGCVQGAAAFTAGPLAAALSPLACTPSPLTTLMACLTVCMAPLTACIIETGIGGRGTCWLHCCCHHTARVAVPPAAEAGESPSCLIPLPPPPPT